MKKVLLISFLSIIFLSVKSQDTLHQTFTLSTGKEVIINIDSSEVRMTILDEDGKAMTMVFNPYDKVATFITESEDETYILASVRNDVGTVSSTLIFGTSSIPYYKYTLDKITKILTAEVKGEGVLTVDGDGVVNY